MTERMDIHDFALQFDGQVDGYAMRSGETHPETYQELLAFLYRRFEITEEEVSTDGLSRWIMTGGIMPGSCSPETDIGHAETVILIGELDDPDSYVASLPADPFGLFLPPTEGVRAMLTQST